MQEIVKQYLIGKAANDDQRLGIDIVRRALRAPARQIADNAGEDGAFIVGKLLEHPDYNWGFNAATGYTRISSRPG